MNISNQPLQSIKLSKELYFRKEYFSAGRIERCYVVYHNRSIFLTKDFFLLEKETAKELIKAELNKIAE